jgi:hypothetical protein
MLLRERSHERCGSAIPSFIPSSEDSPLVWVLKDVPYGFDVATLTSSRLDSGTKPRARTSLRVSRNSLVLVHIIPRTCVDVASTNQLYAFFYEPGKVEKKINAWGIYNPVKEFARMGIGTKTMEWRITNINKDYSVCAGWGGSSLIVVVSYLSGYISCAVKDLG